MRETIATILSDTEEHSEAARRGLVSARREVEHYIAGDPFFSLTFEPYEFETDLLTVRRMSEASVAAGVGPMAAVAAAIAWAGVEEMVKAGADFGLIDNGGDIVFINDREIRVGIHAGNAELSNRLAFSIPPGEGICGICTSSATVGHSLSFGMADSVTVFSPNPAYADAWATSICNRITPEDKNIFTCLPMEGVTGVFIIMGGTSVSYGRLPKIIRADVDENLITGGLI